MAPEIHIVFPSQQMAVRRALEQLVNDLGPLNLDVEDRGTIELVLAEALNNVVEHAYEESPDELIDLKVSSAENGLRFQVVDYGLPMPDRQLPLARVPDPSADIDALPEGGFGWFLIRDLAHELTYERLEGRNVLSFRLAVQNGKDACD